MTETLKDLFGQFLAALVLVWVFYNISLAARGHLKPFFAKPKHFGALWTRVGDQERFDRIARQATIELRERKVARYVPALLFLVGMALTLVALSFVSIEDDRFAYELATKVATVVIGVGLSDFAARKLKVVLLKPYMTRILENQGQSDSDE